MWRHRNEKILHPINEFILHEHFQTYPRIIMFKSMHEFDWLVGTTWYCLVSINQPALNIPVLMVTLWPIQMMAGRVAHTKPLSETMLEYCSWDPYEQISVEI